MFALWLSALLHLYIGWRIAADLPGAASTGVFIALLVASAILIPLAFFGRRSRNRATADRASWAGMLALGLFSTLLVLTLLRDVVLLLAWPFGIASLAPAGARSRCRCSHWPSWRSASSTRAAPRACARSRCRWTGCRAALHGFTIAQISDIHVGPTIKGPYVQAIVDAVNALGADAVAVTGDLVDGRVHDLAAHVAPLAALRSRHGTFFVTGNHEYYSGADEWIAELRRLGVQVLLNEHVVLRHEGAQLVMAGVADTSAHHFDPQHRSDPQRAMHGAPAEAGAACAAGAPTAQRRGRRARPASTCSCRATRTAASTGRGTCSCKLQQPYTAGLHRLKQLWIYTSRGTGYWGPPLRLGAPSEITRLRFVGAA